MTMTIRDGLAEGQVLQRLGPRGARAELTGTVGGGAPSAAVAATLSGPRGPLKGWKGKTVGRAADGKFRARLDGVPAGGPYRLELRAGKASARVGAFYVGDVWVLAGQSNMEGVGNIPGPAKPHPLVRAFSMRREWRLAADPLHLLAESPDSCHSPRQCAPAEGEASRRGATKGAGAGVAFGRKMWERSGVPQGLICAAHGGTTMAQWDPALRQKGGSSLYGSLLLSVRATGQPVAGILWYQGESDASPQAAPLYRARMRKLVAATRRDLGGGRRGLPWVIVQLARVFGPRDNASSWNRIQEEQRLLPDRIADLETVAAIDLPMDDPIHVGSAGFGPLAERLARVADFLVHRNRRERRPPRLRSVSVPRHLKEANTLVIDVRYDDAVGGLRAEGEPSGFALTDAEGNDLRAVYKAELRGAAVRLFVHPNPLPGGVRLSYGHGMAPHCTIGDGRGFSLPVFGPRALSRPTAYCPYVTAWRYGGVLAAPAPLRKIALPIQADAAPVREYAGTGLPGFVNEHEDWAGRSGHAYFSARMELPEAMRLQVLAGFDGPFRLWIDGKPCLDAPQGTNPCLPDEGKKTVSLPAGSHRLHVAMDINGGQAWGFILRFRRLDVPKARIVSGEFARPSYSA